MNIMIDTLDDDFSYWRLENLVRKLSGSDNVIIMYNGKEQYDYPELTDKFLNFLLKIPIEDLKMFRFIPTVIEILHEEIEDNGFKIDDLKIELKNADADEIDYIKNNLKNYQVFQKKLLSVSEKLDNL